MKILSRRGIQTPFLKDAYACAIEPEEQESCDRTRFIPELLVPVPLDKGNAGSGDEIVVSPKISPGFLPSIIVIWLFSNSKTALYMYNVFKYQVPKLQFL